MTFAVERRGLRRGLDCWKKNCQELFVAASSSVKKGRRRMRPWLKCLEVATFTVACFGPIADDIVRIFFAIRLISWCRLRTFVFGWQIGRIALVTDVIRRSDVVSVGVSMTSWLHLALWRLRMDKVYKHLNSLSQAGRDVHLADTAFFFRCQKIGCL